MLFGNSGASAADADESMSVDGAERTRDGSVLVCHIPAIELMEAGLVYA
jgi:hypothetical protein